jgi:hypothetical protein
MSETHAPFWVYGKGVLRLRFAPSRLPSRVRVDGRASLQLHGRGWHLVTVDVPELVRAGERRVGVTLESVDVAPR